MENRDSAAAQPDPIERERDERGHYKAVVPRKNDSVRGTENFSGNSSVEGAAAALPRETENCGAAAPDGEGPCYLPCGHDLPHENGYILWSTPPQVGPSPLPRGTCECHPEGCPCCNYGAPESFPSPTLRALITQLIAQMKEVLDANASLTMQPVTFIQLCDWIRDLEAILASSSGGSLPTGTTQGSDCHAG